MKICPSRTGEPCQYSDSGKEFLTQWSTASTFTPEAE